MTRIRQGFQRGSITNNPLSAASTSISSAAFAALVEVTGGDELVLVLDPEGAFGAAEIVIVTAHAAAASTVTVVRAQEGTANREHPLGTVWRHGPTVADFSAPDVEGTDILSTGETAGKVLTANGAGSATWGTVSGMKKITGTGYQWYVNSGSNVPYGVVTAASASVDTYSAFVQLTAATAQKDELTHVYAQCDGHPGGGSQGHMQVASGGAGSETVITSMIWTPWGTGSYAPEPGNGPFTLPIVVEVAASTRIAVRNKFSRTNGATLVARMNVGYVKASDISDFT